MEEVTFKICLADVPIGVSALYSSTKKFCRDYLTEEEAAFWIRIHPADIEFERGRSGGGGEQGASVRGYSSGYLETLAVYRKIADKMLDYNTLLFHGSAIAVDGECYLFTAKSGTGKSTHTRLWRERFGARAVMVNDDKPLIKVADGKVKVYGTPWDGKHHLSSNVAVRLKALCILERDKTNHIERLTLRDAWPMLMQQCYRPCEPERLAKAVNLLDGLAAQVGLYRLGCNMEPEAVRTAYEGMLS